MRVLGRALLVFVCGASCVLAAEEFPASTGYVNDFAQVLSQDDEIRLTERLTELERSTTAEVTVVTMTTTAPRDVADYAVALFERWGIGKRGNDNGVLVLLAIQDRALRIEVGYGLEGILPDGLVGRIRDEEMTPLLREGRYGDAVWQAVERIGSVMAGHASQDGMPSGVPPVEGGMPWWVLVLALIVFVMLYAAWQQWMTTHVSSGAGKGSGKRASSGQSPRPSDDRELPPSAPPTSSGGSWGGFGDGRSGGGGASGKW